MEKSFAKNYFTMIDRSCDQSTMEKNFSNWRMVHLQSIFHYGDFTLYYWRMTIYTFSNCIFLRVKDQKHQNKEKNASENIY